jgi:hypothetical protein
VSRDFEIPLRVEGDGFILVPLGWKHFMLDYECYMSSVEHLQGTFDLDGDSLEIDGQRWPANSDVEFAFVDAAWCQFEWQHLRSSFTYAALTEREDKELGCGYIMRSKKQPYAVECQTWVRADELENGFDEKFYRWFRHWVEETWPFDTDSIGWPGREISWDEWNRLPDVQALTRLDTRRGQSHPRTSQLP